MGSRRFKMTLAQRRVYFCAVRDACVNQGIMDGDAREEYRRSVLLEAGVESSSQLTKTKYEDVVARHLEDAGQYEKALRYGLMKFRRMSAVILDCLAQIMRHLGRECDMILYLKGVLKRARLGEERLSGGAGTDDWWLDLTWPEMVTLFGILRGCYKSYTGAPYKYAGLKSFDCGRKLTLRTFKHAN